MKNKNFVRTLKDTFNKLKEKNERLLAELDNHQLNFENDPEKSTLHDLWHTYKLQSEFKDFIESLLQKQIHTSKAI